MKKPSATRIVDVRTKYSTKSGCRRMHSGPAINRCCSARPGYQFACCYRPATSYTCLFLKIRTVSSAEFPVSVGRRNSLLQSKQNRSSFVSVLLFWAETVPFEMEMNSIFSPSPVPKCKVQKLRRICWNVFIENFIHFNQMDSFKFEMIQDIPPQDHCTCRAGGCMN